MIIYKAVNKTNGKIYIGQTSKTIDQRKMGHLARTKLGSRYYFHNAIRKYSIDGFSWSILSDNIATRPEADDLEIRYIQQFNSCNPQHGYNLSTGGGGGDNFTNNPRKEEIRQQMRIRNLGKILSIATRQKMSTTRKISGMYAKNKNPMYGKHHTDEHKRKISLSCKGKLPPNKGKTLEEIHGVELAAKIKNKISQSSLGRKFSEAHKKKIGDKHRGKVLSQYTRQKISQSKRGQKPPSTVLTPEIVKNIRYNLMPLKPVCQSWTNYYEVLGQKYHISASIIRKIRFKYVWREI